MDAKNIQIGKFFTNYGVFKVPVYQRGYAWESAQIDDFIEDIKNLLADDMAAARHFFGGVVTVRQSDLSMPGGVYYEVVDGQQRLTTFSIALSSIAHALQDLRAQAEKAGGQDRDIALKRIDSALSVLNGTLSAEPPPVIELGEGNTAATASIPRLTLSEVDEPCFRALLEGGDCQAGTAYSRQLLVRARRSLATRLTQDISGNDALSLFAKVEELLRLATAILNRAEIVHIVGDDPDEGNHLFMVLNTRGKALSAAELIRTHTLRLLQAYGDEQRRAEVAWRGPINRTPTETNNFLRNYYASQAQREARDRSDRGDFGGAQALLQSAAVELRKMAPQSKRSEELLEEAERLTHFHSMQSPENWNESSRKAMHYDEFRKRQSRRRPRPDQQ